MPTPSRTHLLYPLAIAVGAAAGVGAVLFEIVGGFVAWLVLDRTLGYAPAGPHGELHLFEAVPGELWLLGLLLAPAVGGLLSQALCRWFAPEAAGHGTDAVIDAYHNHGGEIRARVPMVKALATAITLGTGGSGGREGPIAQIGAGLGSLLGRLAGMTPRQRRILLAAGMGAGVGAIFRAPLAGALFSAEILYRDAELESEVIIPSFLSSTVAYCVYSGAMLATGTTSAFDHLFGLSGSYRLHDLAELLPYTLLALLLVPVIFLYVDVFRVTGRLFGKMPGWPPLVAAFGGLLCGATGVAAWQLTGDERALAVLSYGYGVLQEALDGALFGWDGARILMVVALLKILTTSLTISSGGSGGVFGPSMVIGGGFGGAVGIACQQWGWVENPGCFVVVGMTGFFAGAARTPVSTIIMVTEMTGSYKLLLPAMWVCGITFLLSSRRTIYGSQVASRAQSAAHAGEYQVALLEKMRVADVFEPEPVVTIEEGTPLERLVRIITESKDDYYPVLDDQERMVGIVSERDVRELLFEEEVYRLAIAADVMTTELITLTPNDDLHTALEKFDTKKLDELPVVAPQDAQRLLGFLKRRTIGRAYQRRLQELREIQQRNA